MLIPACAWPPNATAPQHPPASAAADAMVTTGAVFTVTSVLDPTFLAAFAVVEPSGNVAAAMLSFTI